VLAPVLAPVVSIRQTSNRGPLPLVYSKAKQLGYLDELNCMLTNDDHVDFHCRAFLGKGWVTGHILARFFTNLKEGGVRLSRTQAASDKTPCVRASMCARRGAATHCLPRARHDSDETRTMHPHPLQPRMHTDTRVAVDEPSQREHATCSYAKHV